MNFTLMEDPDIELASPTGSDFEEEASASIESIPIEEGAEEEDDLYYIPERRPSLDLGPAPMETGELHYIEPSRSPVLSYKSMRSEGIGSSGFFGEGYRSPTRLQLERTGSFSSCYSLDSDDCEKRILKDKSTEEAVPGPSLPSELMKDPGEEAHPSLTIAFTFKTICKVLQKLTPFNLEKFKMVLWQCYPQSFITSQQNMDIVDIVDRMLECYSLQVSLQITKTLLQELEQKKLINFLEDLQIENEVRYDLCKRLKKMYGPREDSAAEGERRPLDDVYTNLYIKSVGDNGPNIEHEVMNIQKLETKNGKDLSIKDIFSTDWMNERSDELILLSGVAGCGKSTAIRKLILDWSEQKTHEHISLLFPLPFKELKRFEDADISFLDIIQTLYPETKKLKQEHYRSSEFKLMYIFDGLEEVTGNIDFEKTMLVFDITEPAKLNVLIVNILRGKLLNYSVCLLTSRPLVDFFIPWDTHHSVFEVLGFQEGDREKYFQKRFIDRGQAARVIAYVKSSITLHIMCHLPLFCSLVADICQSIFNAQGSQAELPRGITYMYTKLFLALIHGCRKVSQTPNDKQKFIMALGKRAFAMLEKGEYHLPINYHKDDGEPVDEHEAVTYSGLCTQFYTKPHLFVDEKIFSFIHPTMQEYVAALYAFLTVINEDKSVFEQEPKARLARMFKGNKKGCMDLYKTALERSLLCEDGKLDIFMRFLFGLSNRSNNELIQQFFTSSVKWMSVTKEAEALIRKKILENQYPSRKKNLELCLEEL